MKIVRSGIILNTENYEACVAFYKELFGLEILYEKNEDDFQLTCFDNYGSYLMVEMEGKANPNGKPITEGAAKLRFNVADIEDALKTVKTYGIDAKIEYHDWGNTINIHDPDGNRVGIRDESTFK